MPKKAIHHGIHAAQGNFGTWIPSGLNDNKATQAQCQAKCEATEECTGYSFRHFAAPFKCYMHNSQDITYADKAASNGGFTSSVCNNHEFNKEIERDGQKFMRNCFGTGLMKNKALHHGIHAQQGNFGSLLKTSLHHSVKHGSEACAEECENDLKCGAWSYRKFAHPYICYLHPHADLNDDINPNPHGGFDSAICTETPILTEPVHVEMVVAETIESFTEEKQSNFIEEIAAEVGVPTEDVSITLAENRRLLEGTTGLKVVVTIAVHFEENNEEALLESVGAVAEKIVEKLESEEFTQSTGATFIGFEAEEADESDPVKTAFQAVLAKKVQSATAKKTVAGSDRTHYSPTESKECCVSDCDSQASNLQSACKKGCERWIAHTSLNWKSGNRVALRKRCKVQCTREINSRALGFPSGNQFKLHSSAVGNPEEDGCHVGCDVFDTCSYEKLEN